MVCFTSHISIILALLSTSWLQLFFKTRLIESKCIVKTTNSLMQAARETGALKEAKDKLEKRVEELTWRLEFEKHLRVYSPSTETRKSVGLNPIILSNIMNHIKKYMILLN